VRATSLILALLPIAACATPGRPAALARADHALFWNPEGKEEVLAFDERGAAWQHGELDQTLHARLAAAWARGEAPAPPLYGRDPGAWLRAVEILPAGADGWLLRAKALAPLPIRLTLFAESGGELRAIGWSESAPWNRNTHFARVDAGAPPADGALLVVRVEGGYQAFESRLRLVRR
jgi:hypothetical protein